MEAGTRNEEDRELDGPPQHDIDTTPEETEPDIATVPDDEEEQQPTSVLSQLKERRAALNGTRRKTMEIPGYSGMLAVRFKLIDWEKAKAIGKRASKNPNPRSDLLAAMDTIALATEEMLIKPEGDEAAKLRDELGYSDEEFIPMREAVEEFDPDVPVLWDQNLARALDVEPNPRSPVRSIIYSVFGRNDMAVVGFHTELMGWLQSNNDEVDEDF